MEAARLNGQWIGQYSGTNSGAAVLELDDRGTHFEGWLYGWVDNPDLPDIAIRLETPIGKPAQFVLPVDIRAVNRATGVLVPWDDIAQFYEGVTFPTKGDLKISWKSGSIDAELTTDIGTSGQGTLFQSQADQPSELKAQSIKTWDEFKAFASKLPHYEYIYRGQESNRWRLRTHFHRTGRADLKRFLDRDTLTVQQHITPYVEHIFNRLDPIENAAFLSLIQHHGYPTPMLDWTYSPYIAAYFAYNDLRPSDIQEGKDVRIFIFDKGRWEKDHDMIGRLTAVRPHFSVLDTSPINNNRLIPQQALTTVSNIDDIEHYLQFMSTNKKEYLQAVDLPTKERDRIMKELHLMGITAGSLFPGLDGVCKSLKERYFRFQP